MKNGTVFVTRTKKVDVAQPVNIRTADGEELEMIVDHWPDNGSTLSLRMENGASLVCRPWQEGDAPIPAIVGPDAIAWVAVEPTGPAHDMVPGAVAPEF